MCNIKLTEHVYLTCLEVERLKLQMQDKTVFQHL